MREKTSKFKAFYWFFAGMLLLSVVRYMVFAQQPDSVSTTASELIMDDLKLNIHDKNNYVPQIREGTVFKNQNCEFRLSGNRVLLLIDGEKQRFLCLENMNLERIVKVLHENQFMNFWRVDFIVTEYQKNNYALIQRAILNPSAQNRPKDSRSEIHEIE